MNDRSNMSIEEKRKLAAALLARKEREHKSAEAPVAILGFGCRYPGGVVDGESFWRLLDGGLDAIREVPRSRWDADALYDPDPDALGRSTTRSGGFLDHVEDFDPAFFGIAAREAMHLDPQQRLLLETAWEALEHAGIAPGSLLGAQAGVFVGVMSHDYETIHPHDLASLDGHVLLGSARSVASGRLSYLLGVKGPSVTIDTACSSSLVAIHLACASLRSGESNLALAGGSTLILSPRLHVEFARMRGLSPDGRCKSFSESADGVGWAEGCGVVALKLLDDAIRDGDPILGVIRGSAVNQDGRSNGMTAPNGPSQEAVVRRALAVAGLDRHDVDYIEAHGTGTTLGDPIEAFALSEVFGPARPRPLWLGSVKSNFGHTQAASGVAGLIKVLLSMRHERLPTTLHATAPSAKVDWSSSPLRLVTESVPWPRGRRLAGISSFGISGTNAHLVIEEPPARPEMRADEKRARLVPISAHTSEALIQSASRLAAHLGRHPDLSIDDVAHTLGVGRTPSDHRAFVVAASTKELGEELSKGAAARRTSAGKIAFLCTGQGSQLPGMGRTLHAQFPVFRDAFDRLANRLDFRQFEIGAEIHRTDFTQPSLFVLGWALSELWRSWGVAPDLVLGHSVGEFVAAAIAGVFSPEDGLALVTARGRLMQQLCEPGVMISIDASEREVAAKIDALGGDVSIAAINGPRQIVISGDARAASEVAASFGGGKRLETSHAFHSPRMQPMLDRFAEAAARVRYAAPKVSIASNVTGASGDEMASADYWVRHVLAPVRFADGVGALHAAGARTFVEIGARPVLLGMAARVLEGEDGVAWLPSLRGERDEARTILAGAGALFQRGIDLAWKELGPGRRIELPTTAFQRTRCWIPKAQPPWSSTRDVAAHPLLGARVPSPAALAIFESTISAERLPWLSDHRVFGTLVVPGAALLEWAQAAADAQLGEGTHQIAELVVARALVVGDDETRRAQAVLREKADGIRFALFSAPTDSDAWIEHANGRLTLEGAPLAIPERLAPTSSVIAPETIYARFAEGGLPFGPAFRGVRAAWRHDGVCVADVSLDGAVAEDASRHRAHPALIDAILHPIMLDPRFEGRGLFLPFSFDDVTFGVSGARAVRVRAELRSDGADAMSGTTTAWTLDGELVLHVGRMNLRRVSPETMLRRDADDAPYELRWNQLASASSSASPRRVTVVASTPSPIAETFVSAAQARGIEVDVRSVAEPAASSSDSVVFFASSWNDALSIAQTWLRRDRPDARLLWVTERAQAVRDGDEVSPTSAAAWGLGRVLLIEGDERSTTLVDVAAADVDALIDELATRDGESEIVLRDGARFAPRLRKASTGASRTLPSLSRGAVVITGGLGAVGLGFARHLADAYGARHLVLLGRNAPEVAPAAIVALRERGVRVDMMRADVADRAALSSALGRIDAPIVGVVHAAGIGDACLLAQQTEERFANALRAKVDGAVLLDELTREAPLSLFVLVSSMASILPVVGQASYAAANAFLDGLAHARRARGLPALSVDLGPWAEGGMMEQLAEAEHERLRSEGVLALSSARAMALFDAAMRHGGAQLALLDLDLERRRRMFAGRDVPSIWRELLPTRTAPAAGSAGARTQLATLDDRARIAAIVEIVRTEVARIVSRSNDDVPREKRFVELGIDSLTGVELRNRIGARLGITLAASVIWDHPTVELLAAHLAERVREHVPIRRAPSARRPLRLHPEPSLPPIFAVGGGLGGATYFKDLAHELGPLQPFFTASYPGLEDEEAPLDDMHALATYFLEHLRAVAPRGPYVLVGHSFGGVVAFEMARRLAREGESVLELVLLDSWTSGNMLARFDGDAREIEPLLRPFLEAGRGPADPAAYRAQFERIWAANGRALERYTPEPYDGDVTLIVPDDDVFTSARNVDEWKALCRELKVRRTSGNHSTMVLPPHARQTGRILRSIVRDPGEVAFERTSAAPKTSIVAWVPSRSQQWMSLLHQLSGGSALYNVFFGVRLRGALDRRALDRALEAVVARHDALRTSFTDASGELRAVAGERVAVPLVVRDLANVQDRAEAEARVKRELTAPFALSRGPLGRAVLCSFAADEHQLLFCFHHAIMDGTSGGLFLRDLLALYDREALGDARVLPGLPWSSEQHASWERRRLDDARLEALRAWWRDALQGMPALRLPLDRQAPAARSDAGGLVDFSVDGRLATSLRALAAAEGSTVFMLLLSAFGALLHRYGAGDDFGVATVLANRPRDEMRDMIGCFVNTTVVRFSFPAAITARELLAHVRARTIDALEHGDFPFDELTRTCAPKGSALTSACFAFEPSGHVHSETLDCTPILDTVSGDVAGTAKFDLSLSMTDDGQGRGLRASLVYATDVLDDDTARRIAGHFETLLSGLVEDPTHEVARLPLLTSGERNRLLVEWNATAVDRGDDAVLHTLVEARAARSPDAIAVVDGDRTLTYRELDERANALAWRLRAHGAGPEERVSLCAERSVEMVIALLAILKTGAAYVPLDPSYPAERTRFMREDSRSVAIVATKGTADVFPDALVVDEDARDRAPDADVSPKNLAYLIYTSGSTGRPKAVAIEHRAAVELVRWARETFDDLSSVLASTSICFDLSVFEIFAPLACGGTVVLAENALALPRVRHPVTLVNTVPSAAAELVAQGGIPDSVRVINLAGEPLRRSLVDAIYASTRVERVYDLYGPSEDTTYSTFALRARGGPETIGRPLPNTRAYVLDETRQPLPVGVAGELYLAGAKLARGYFDRPELTAERFVEDPFHGGRMYRTGDRARFRPDGTIELLGRADHQVKLRGFRIELGEVEGAMREVVDACVVDVRDARLVAWFVGAAAPSDLRAHLSQTLPAHMIPSSFVPMAALPLTPNGKIDRKALPSPEATAPSGEPPRVGIEEAVGDVFREVLAIDRVGRDDHFFELGGSSLLAARAAAKLSGALGREIRATALFGYPILRALAAHLGGEANPAPRGAPAAATTAQKVGIGRVGQVFAKKANRSRES